MRNASLVAATLAMMAADSAAAADELPPPKPRGLTAADMKPGGFYNWKGQPERLVYLRRFNGWHQFAKVGDLQTVWCEVLDEDLHLLEETVDEASPQPQEIPKYHFTKSKLIAAPAHLRAEIEAHNAEVDRKRAEKMARKGRR